MQKTYFKNLDGLRFLSFLFVFTHHCFIGFKNTPDTLITRLFHLEKLGVNFFFVLSGFLITYIILQEKKKTANFTIFRFYLKRVLRIWPLYYAVMLFGYFIWPFLRSKAGLIDNAVPNPLFCFTFLNNFLLLHYQNNLSSIISVFWSVAIEEQFYLVWPIIFLFKNRISLFFIGVFILVSVLFRFYFNSIYLIDFHTLGVISYLAVGGVIGYLTVYSSVFIEKIRKLPKIAIFFIYVVTIIFSVFEKELFTFTILSSIKPLFFGIFFGLIIVEQNFSLHSIFKMGNFKIISQLGVYTYGLYCLHSIAISLVKHFFDENFNWITFLMVLLISLVLSIVLAFVSFTYFEKYFLNLKEKF